MFTKDYHWDGTPDVRITFCIRDRNVDSIAMALRVLLTSRV
jgi:hypothetical protein